MSTTQLANMRIETSIESYESTSNGKGCTGIVVWNTDGEYFPDERWNDFVLVLACWWLSSLNQLESSEGTTVFQFMDGPFSIECDRIGSEVQGKFIDGRKNRKVVSNWTLSVGGLKEEVVAFSKSVLAYCDQHKIGGNDVEQLRKSTSIM